MLPLLAAALVLAAGPANFSDAIPPAEFQQDGAVTLRTADPEEVSRACEPLYGSPPPGQRTWACEVNGTVIAPNPCSFPASDFYAQLLCHEIGHAAGWPASHPGGRPLAKAVTRERTAALKSRRGSKAVRTELAKAAKPEAARKRSPQFAWLNSPTDAVRSTR